MSDSIARFDGLPIEAYERPEWYPLPDGFEYVDWFDAFDGGDICTFDLHLLRDRKTGRLVVEAQYGEDGKRTIRLPLAVSADVTSFGALAKVLAEGVRS